MSDRARTSKSEMAAMRERSPMAHVDKVKAAVLMGLGTDDRRVPCAQGQRYFAHLDRRGVPCKLLKYKAQHGLADKTAFVNDYVTQCGLWFLTHIGPPPVLSTA